MYTTYGTMKNNKLNTNLYQLYPKYIYLNSLTEKLEMLKELKHISGIYLWYNNTTQNYYIGSAKDLSNRLARYYRQSELIRVKGSLIHKALLTYGHSKFTVYILETCNNDELIIREQYYLDLLTPIYNILKLAYSSKNYLHTDDTKILISKIKLEDPKLMDRMITLSEMNKGRKHSIEFKILRSELTKGHNNPNFGKGNSVKEFDIIQKKEIIYSSVSNAAKAHNTARSIIRYCINKNTVYKNRYKFMYYKFPYQEYK
jgi:group I intron endonuclease